MHKDQTDGFHVFQVLTDSVKPAEGHRLSTVMYKTPKDKKNDASYVRPTNMCISVPRIKVSVTPACLQDALQAAFEELQDSVLRSIYEKAREDGKKVVTVADAAIDFQACAEFAAANAVNGKLSKETLMKWFDENLAENLTVALANALKLPDEPSEAEAAKLDAAVKQHKLLIVDLASPRANMPEHIAKSLLKAVDLAEDDKVKASLKNKLDVFIKPKEVTLNIGL